LKDNINILGLNILNTTYEEMSSLVENKIENREKFSFHNVNASILLNYCKNEHFRKNLNSFSALLSDGIGVFRASRILYGKDGLRERITGTDLYYYILKLAGEKQLRCFFFGGSSEAVMVLPETLRNKYPGLHIAGILPRETDFKTDTVEKINNSNPDILFVGLGTPHQEEWIARYFNSIDAPIQIAVGSGIEFISGAKKRAPGFYRKAGLEWLYRIYLEPKRLWKRYFFGIPIFMFKIIILKVKLLLNLQKN
jgi:N-acetylglucosaminyldiphosphoundecaprenol N-acetyl-beta-D-mannosaminyltransferase